MLSGTTQDRRRPVFSMWPLVLIFLLLGAGLTSIAAFASPTGEAIGRANLSGVNGPGIAAAIPLTTVCSVASGSIVPSPNNSVGGRTDFQDVAALSANDVWAVGYALYTFDMERAVIEHWDGSQWSIVPSPRVAAATGNLFRGVTAVAANNVWAVGSSARSDGTRQTLVMRWDGSRWSIVPSPNVGASGELIRVDALSANDIWAVGYYTTGAPGEQHVLILHWDGAQWSIVPGPALSANSALRGVAAISANDVWAVGSVSPDQTLTLHWNGAQWSRVPSPMGWLVDVSAVSATDVWAIGKLRPEDWMPTLTLHWDGAAWRVVPSPSPGQDVNFLSSVEAISTNDVWAVGYYGTKGSNHALPLHWDGQQWNVLPDNLGRLTVVGAVSASDVWTFGAGFFHWNGAMWSAVSSPYPTLKTNTLRGMEALSANDVWAVGSAWTWTLYGPSTLTLVEHWDGTQWSIVPSPNHTPSPAADVNNYLVGITALSPNDIWAVGYFSPDNPPPFTYTLVEHWDGTQWSIVPSANYPDAAYQSLGDVVAVSANDVWAVGSYSNQSSPDIYKPVLQHWDGSAWSSVSGPSVSVSAYLSGVSAVSANDVWAVGHYLPTASGPDQTLTMHWDGTQWNVVPSPNVGTDRNLLWSVSALASNDVWAVGGYGPGSTRQTLIIHWDGTSWTQVTSPNPGTGNYLWDVKAISADDVWAVGYDSNPSTGVVQTLALRWDGTRWATVSSGNADDASNNFLYAVGAASQAPNGQVWAVGNYESSWESLTLVEQYGPPTFTDVPPDNPFYTYISALACRGIVSGYADGTFRPGNLTTRGQLCKIVTLAQGWQLYTPPVPTFRDVPPTDPFYTYIETAYSHGVISGYDCGPGCLEFRPGNNVTRGQLCKIVVLAAGWTLYTPPTPTFRDVSPGDRFYEYIETAYDHGIISGYNCGAGCLEFRPGNNATRGQICKIVYNAISQP